MKEHPVFAAICPISLCLMALIMKLNAASDTPEFSDFSRSTVCGLWILVIAGDHKKLKPEGCELVWCAFHKFRKELLVALNIYEEGQHIYIIYQYLLVVVIEIIMERHRMICNLKIQFKNQSQSQKNRNKYYVM